VICLELFICITFLVSCSDEIKYNYDTLVDYEKLTNLQGKKLVLLSYSHNEAAFVNSDTLDSSFADIVNDKLKARVIEKYNSLFKVVDLTGASKSEPARNYLPNDMHRVIKENGANGGIIVINAFGYKMKGPSGVLWALLETLVPKDHKKSYRAVLGHSEVERYYFASKMYILDSDGNIVWNFAGKTSVYPSVDFNLNELLRSFGGMDPSSQKVANVMLETGAYYSDFNMWLIKQDFAKSLRKDYFSDYPEEKRNNLISVYPAMHEGQLPTLEWNSSDLNIQKAPEATLGKSKMAKPPKKVEQEVLPTIMPAKKNAPGTSVLQSKAITDKSIPTKTVATDRETIRLVQQLLTDLGYEPGPIDGLMGKRTTAAILVFQQKTGLPETGKISETLLTKLRGNSDN
jgi:hypothetical protein